MRALVMFSGNMIFCLLIFSSLALTNVYSCQDVEPHTETNCSELNKPGWKSENLRNMSVDSWPWDCLLSYYTESFLNQLGEDVCRKKRRSDPGCIRHDWIFHSIHERSLEDVARWENVDVMRFYVEERNRQVNDTKFLIAAASSGNVEMMKYLVHARNITTAAEPSDMPNALHAAVISGNLEMVRFVVENLNYNVDFKDNFGRTPAHLAAESSFSILEVTNRRGAAYHAARDAPENLLHSTTLSQLAILEYLIDQKGAALNAKSDADETLLHFAASMGQLEIVKYLVEKKNMSLESKDLRGNTPLLSAVVNGQENVVRYLFDKGNLDNGSTITLLDTVTREGYLNILKYLVDEKNFVINTTDLLPKMAGAHHFDIFKYLVEEKNANVEIGDSEGRNLFLQIANYIDYDFLKYLLLDRKVHLDCTADNSTCVKILYVALYFGNLKLVKYLVDEKGVDVYHNRSIGLKWTVLEDTIITRRLDIIEYLMVEKRVNFSCEHNWEFCDAIIDTVNRKHGYSHVLIYLDKEKEIEALKCNRLCWVSRMIDYNFLDMDTIKYIYEEKKIDLLREKGPIMSEAVLLNVSEYLIYEKKEEVGEILNYLINRFYHPDVVEYLVVEKKVDFKCNTNKPICKEILHTAVINKSLALVKNLLEEKGADGDWDFMLIEAVKSGDLDILKYLMDRKKAYEKSNELLEIAAKTANLNMIQYFIKQKKTNIECVEVLRTYLTAINDDYKFTPKNKLNTLKYLVDKVKSSDINGIKDHNGRGWDVVIRNAVDENDLDVIKYLLTEKNVDLKSASDPNYYIQKKILSLGVQCGDIGFIRSLFGKGANISGSELLHMATEMAQLGIMKYLVTERKIQADSTELFNAYLSSIEGKRVFAVYNLDIIMYLVNEMGAHINSTKLLLRYLGHVDEYLRCPWDIYESNIRYSDLNEKSAGRYRFKDIPSVLKAKESVYFSFYFREENYPASSYDTNIIRYYLEKGAHMDSTELLHKYFRSLDDNHVCIGNERPRSYDLNFIKYLIEQKKADIKDKYGNNLLLMTSFDRSRSINIFKYLLEETGADILSKDSSGKNILHIAARENNLHLIKYLIEERSMSSHIDDVDYYQTSVFSMAPVKSLVPKYLAKKKREALHTA